MNGLHYTLAGEQRKQMAQVISEIIQEKVVYKRVPTCAYQIGSFSISKDGVLSWAEDTDTETVKGVVAGLQIPCHQDWCETEYEDELQFCAEHSAE